MIDQVREAVTNDPTIDITTTGRHSGDARRIEIWMLAIDDRFFITGTPGPRGWLANVRNDPRVVVHVKNGMHADLVAWAHEVTDEPTRRMVLAHDAAAWYRTQAPIERLLVESPLIEITFDITE
jgi:deazaflavin-dependent oxidoreductase (nitroreductase family)